MEAFTVQRESRGTIEVVTVAGDVDAATAPQVRDVVDEALAASTESLVVDLTPVGFMDSAGLTLLMLTQRRAEKRDRRVIVAVPPGNVRRVLEMTGLDQEVELADTLDQAFLALGDGN